MHFCPPQYLRRGEEKNLSYIVFTITFVTRHPSKPVLFLEVKPEESIRTHPGRSVDEELIRRFHRASRYCNFVRHYRSWDQSVQLQDNWV